MKKFCPDCGEEKSIFEFFLRKGERDRVCKACANAQVKLSRRTSKALPFLLSKLEDMTDVQLAAEIEWLEMKLELFRAEADDRLAEDDEG